MPDISEKSFNTANVNRITACQILEKRLLECVREGHVFVTSDALGVHDLGQIAVMQQNLAEQGATLLVIDASTIPGARGHLYDAMQSYVANLEMRRQLDKASQDLFEFLNISFHQSPNQKVNGSWNDLYRDALSRLWVSLACHNRLSLLIMNVGQLSSLDRDHLQHLMRFFYSDPIRSILPETTAWDRARGAVVLVGAGWQQVVEESVEYEVLTLSSESEQIVREFLAREDVVQRFVRTIGGDATRLDDLVSMIPEGVEQFWMHRFRRLDTAAQRLVEVLACAEGWLGADRLHDASNRLGVADHFARHLNTLIHDGFIRRKVGSGQVLLALEHQEFSSHVVQEIAEEELCAVHLALAESELECGARTPCVTTLARHFFAAGCGERSVQYGLLAAQQFVARCEFEAALSVLEPLLIATSSAEQLHEIHGQLADINAALGNYRKSLFHHDYLESDLSGDTARIEWLCKAGSLLVKIGQGQNALQMFEQAEVLLGTFDNLMLEREVFTGKGEACYALGDSKGAMQWANLVLEKVGRVDVENAGENARSDGNLIRSRNLLGKIAIFEANYSLATEYFQQNNQLAMAWGWEREVARAQANLGVVQLQLRNYGAALERLTHALELSRIPGTLPRAHCLLNLGIVHQRQANFELALSHYLEALRASRRAGDMVAYSISAHNLATLYQDMGAFERAWKLLEHLELQADEQFDQPEMSSIGRHTFVNRWTAFLHGHLLLEQERFAEALDAFAEISETVVGLGEVVYGAEARLRLVEANLELGNIKQAQKLLAAFEESEQSVEEPQLNALIALYKCRLALENNGLERALELGKSASTELTRLGMFRDGLQAELVVAEVFIQTNNSERAHVRLQQAIQTIRLRSERVPEEFRVSFYALAVHRKLIERFQSVNGEVPVEFRRIEQGAVSVGDEKSANIEVVRPVRDAAFEQWRTSYSSIVGESARLHQIFRFIDRVAASDTIVLLTGESGTGKELVAEALHERSERAKKTFVRVNCAAFVESLLLSELFGHEKGAFTGAQSARLGRFELADGGTLFLDEIGDISPNTQVALLRVLQEGTFERVGGTETRRVNVRVICATNKNLDEMVKRGEFRLDLYYRLKGLVIELPALRERREDIPRLLTHFAEIHSQSAIPRGFSVDAMRFLCAYSWTGNIRELENLVKSILLFVEGDTVEMSHIDEFREFFADGEINLELPEIAYEYEQSLVIAEPEKPAASGQASWLETLAPDVDAEEALVEHIVAQGLSLTKLKKRLELECIKRALEETDGNITRAADLLQMKRPRLSQIINSSPELMNYRAELVG